MYFQKRQNISSIWFISLDGFTVNCLIVSPISSPSLTESQVVSTAEYRLSGSLHWKWPNWMDFLSPKIKIFMKIILFVTKCNIQPSDDLFDWIVVGAVSLLIKSKIGSKRWKRVAPAQDNSIRTKNLGVSSMLQINGNETNSNCITVEQF